MYVKNNDNFSKIDFFNLLGGIALFLTHGQFSGGGEHGELMEL